MYESYADTLESYLIAEEGFFSKIKEKKEELVTNKEGKIKIEGELRKIFTKLNMFLNTDTISFSRLGYLIETEEEAKKISSSDLKIIHKYMYNDNAAIDYFAPSNDQHDVSLIKKYKPIPFYGAGNGDHYCYTANGIIKEYIHDANLIFDAEYARDYKSYDEWLKKYFLPLQK